MTFTDALQWRYATKKMNGQQVPQEKVETILEAIRMAPTSMGLQPFKVFTITDEDIKKQILPIAHNQTQIVDSSHLLVFAAWDQLTDQRIEEYVQLTASERNVSLSELEPMKKSLQNIGSKSDDDVFAWTSRQVYIALGFALAAAAMEQVDTTPMEGFKNAELDEFLGLKEQGMRSVTLLPLGYRDEENDWAASMPKVRKSNDVLFSEPNLSLN